LSGIASSFIGLAINLAVVLVFAIFSGVEFTWLVLLVPFSIIQLLVLAIGISLITSTLYVKYRDISQIWEVILQAMFYAVPIIYPLSFVAISYPFFAQVLLLNPVAQTIQDVRHNLIAPETTPTTWNFVEN